MSEIAGSKKAQRELQRRVEEKEAQRLSDLKWVMSDPRGRRFMFNLIEERCLVFSASYTGNSETYLREGRRAVGISIMKEVQDLLKDQYVAMISEAFSLKQRDEHYEQIAKNEAKGDDE